MAIHTTVISRSLSEHTQSRNSRLAARVLHTRLTVLLFREDELLGGVVLWLSYVDAHDRNFEKSI